MKPHVEYDPDLKQVLDDLAETGGSGTTFTTASGELIRHVERSSSRTVPREHLRVPRMGFGGV